MKKNISNIKIVKRKAYKPLTWLCKKVTLEFSIKNKYVIVKSKLFFFKNNVKKNQSSDLILYGKNLETLNLKINFNNIYQDINLKNLNLKNEKLTIKTPSNINNLIFKSKVKLYPKENYSLEGMYESNNMICTQCEPEGFRKITWFPDRPDNLSIFTVKIKSSIKYKYLLSNGNLIKNNNSKLNGYVVWKDPFFKPSYLFALVAGNFDVSNDEFFTKSGKKVLLQIYTEIGNKKFTKFAMQSLKKAMSWDEEKYGLEYDLDRFMIVAVDHFNMGAMENKGLNIFNSKYVLADENTATDQDLINIESIIAHEYFHNWTGNRVTCRDWFQLTLKEGLTVFRDQQFSSDIRGNSLKRIEDVKLLRSIQFPEDQGSNKHPIRPEKYEEINNFYTPTVYEKGAEVIRMLYNYLGEKKFIASVRHYLSIFDGKAATCEDFLQSLEKRSKLNLTKFFNWYEQSGIIDLKISRNYHFNQLKEIEITQKCDNYKKPLPIPIRLSFISKDGTLEKFKINKSKLKNEHIYLFKSKSAKIKISNVKSDSVPSLMRNFSAPVRLNADLNSQELLKLVKYENDDFNRWEAVQKLHLYYFYKGGSIQFCKVINDLLTRNFLNYSIMSLILQIPSLKMLEQNKDLVDPLRMFFKREEYLKNFCKRIEKNLLNTLLNLIKNDYEGKAGNGSRDLLSVILPYLCSINNQVALKVAFSFLKSKNMTILSIALKSFISNKHPDTLKFLNNFYKKFSNNNLVVQKWFELMASIKQKNQNSLEVIRSLLKHQKFDYKNPNKIRSVLGTFQRENIELFHANDESGYDFISKEIIKIDKINPQISARLVLPLTLFNNYTFKRQKKMSKYLKIISDSNPSNDLHEIISKAID